MARTEQEKLDAKREREYEKKHKRKYRLTWQDVIFNICNYGFFSIFTISCNEYLVWEYFLKYEMFYRWLTDDYYMVGSISQNYYYSEKRENVYEVKYSDDLSLFYKIFKNDKEFIEIKNKYKK